MKKVSPLIVLTIIAGFLIFYRFASIPKYLAFDEVEFAKLALSLDGKPYTPYSLLATGHSTLYFYILLVSLKIFGINTFALRLPAAIFGVFSVMVFYLVARLSFRAIRQLAESREILKKRSLAEFTPMKIGAWDDIVPFLLTLIFLTSRWFLTFSRFAFEPTFLLFLELSSIYFFIRTVPRSEGLSLILSGIFAGLSFNSYTPGRIFFLLPLSFLTLQTLKTFKLYKLLFFIIPFIITVIPLTAYFLTHQDSRIDQLFFWQNHEMTINQKIQGTIQNVSSLTLMFFTKGDMNGRHNYPGKPALNPIMAGLFLIGLFYSLKNLKNHYNQLFVGYFLISLIPSIPIYPWENPSMLRTFTVIPSIVYFVGVGLTVILGRIRQLAATTPESVNNDSGPDFAKALTGKRAPLRLRSGSLARMTIIALVFLSSFYELRTYFKYQSKVFESSFEIKHPLEKAIKLKNPYEK